MVIKRMVFDWEVDIWEQFKECLQRIHLDCDFNDKLIWEHTPSGCYSTNSFCRSILDNNESTVDLSRNVWIAFAPPKVEGTSQGKCFRECPPRRWFKFNTDEAGAAKGCRGQMGIGGVLRDEKRAIKMVFSKCTGWDDSNIAEAMASHEAMMLFAASSWASTCVVIIESDSKNAVMWVASPIVSPWKLQNLVLQIKALKEKVSSFIKYSQIK
ncbi:Uncharacterized protein TCM_019904 [Theobroma cacao]|uniref:RNase H type-1 domain-containing protein n=1 Tax=Theobroma cacao TaxID=3641 RepID=A0A061EIA7_THECC|nr:Uncharacterized protein TCM_019904 [Theobroma cacao]